MPYLILIQIKTNMGSKSEILKYIIISFIFLQSGISYSAVKFYQSSKVKDNGSIIMTFTYSAKESDLKDNMAGNLPFVIEDVRKFFYSPDSEIKKSLVYIDPTDKSISSVTVDIEVRDINKISEIKGLENFKTHWMKSDTGMVFTWLVPVSFVKTNLIDTYQFILSFEDKIRSSNGVIKENNCNWYIFADKMNPGGAYFITTVEKTEGNSTTAKTTAEPEVKSSGNNKSEDADQQVGKPKSCGVFSIELPVIIFSGLIFSGIYRKRKK